MTDLSRRNFLNGIMATAGAVAVGMPTIAAAVEALVPPVLPFPDHDAGDVFMKVNDIWRFLGRSTTWTVHAERESFIDSRMFIGGGHEYRGLLERTANIDICLDDDGRQMLYDEVGGNGCTDFALSQGKRGLYTLKKSFVRGFESTVSKRGITETVDLVIGDIEVSFHEENLS